MLNLSLISEVRNFRSWFGTSMYDKQGRYFAHVLPEDLKTRYFSIDSFITDYVYNPIDFAAVNTVSALLYWCKYNQYFGYYDSARGVISIKGLYHSETVTSERFCNAMLALRDPNPVYILTIAEKLLPDFFAELVPQQQTLF